MSRHNKKPAPQRQTNPAPTALLQPLLSTTKEEEQWRDPSISPAGADGEQPRTETTAAPASLRKRNERLVARWAEELEQASASEILRWAAEYVEGAIAVTLSMQDTILAELAEEAFAPGEAELVFLDTGYHFPETLSTAAKVEQRYRLPLRRITPTLSRAEQDATYGPKLYQRNPTACCRMRKVEPLARMLDPFDAWVSGVRRADSPLRANTPVVEVDRTGRLKLNPIAAWTDADTKRFVASKDLIINPLTTQGYPSIGCATCTLPVAPGEDPRSGRWAGTEKTECGLHL